MQHEVTAKVFLELWLKL